MSRRRTSFPLATAILISLLATAGSALAQPPSPAAPEPAAVQAPVQPWERPLGLEPMRVPAAQVVDLGQPGLSFRYAGSFGTSGTPYLADTQHLNRPNGIFVDGSGSLYVVEERGYRLLRYDASGANTLSAGQPGRPWHQDSYLAYPKDVAVDGTGTIWAVMDPALKRFDAAGNVLGTFPASNPWQPGSGNTRFDDPRGIAFDGAGRMFVSDSRNQRVQVYTLAGGTPAYSLTIGETGVPGSNNAHFRFPGQVAVDSSNKDFSRSLN